jgi:hypothetical protein
MNEVLVEKSPFERELDKVRHFINEEDELLTVREREISLQSIERLNMTEIMRAITSLLVWNSVSSIVSLGVTGGMTGFAIAQGAIKLQYFLPTLALNTIDFIGKYLFLRYRFKDLISNTTALKAATPYGGLVMLTRDLLKGHPELNKALKLYLTTGTRQLKRRVTNFFKSKPQPNYGHLYAMAQ